LKRSSRCAWAAIITGARAAGGSSGDPLTRPHPRATRHLLDPRPEGRSQHELVGLLVVEVHEAGIRGERVRCLSRDEREHLLEVERRVDRRDRLRQQAQVARRLVHTAIVGSRAGS
jgi:hypothetical protein